MTSLFRRSSSGSGGGGGGGGGGATGARGAGTGAGDGSAAPQELNNSRPARQVRRLEFNQAMDDFKTMFPNMDYDIIECVLRANSGAVDATIDQLLQMNLEAGGGSTYEDSSDSEDSIPPEVKEGRDSSPPIVVQALLAALDCSQLQPHQKSGGWRWGGVGGVEGWGE